MEFFIKFIDKFASIVVDFIFKKPPSLPMFSSSQTNQSKLEMFKSAFKEIFIGTGKYILLGSVV